MKATHHRLSNMVKHDLEKIAEQLPETGENHKTLIIWWYKCRGWSGVEFYIDSVNQSIASPEPLQEDFYTKAGKYITQVLSSLREAVIGLF